MALQLWETLKEAITLPYTATFFTVLALLCAIYYVLTGPFGSPRDPHLKRTAPEEQMEALPPPVQARVSEITTKEELEQSDGSESDGVAQSSSKVFTASSSSSPHHPRYQVFLSFRGEDTRHNFTSHLLKALKGRGINVFFDEEELKKGEELSPALLNAIKASKVSIVILSKDYASSKSCLTELSKIMECKLTQGQIVLPIFYHVNPSDVRHHAGSFEESFNQHLIRKPGEVERWKAAFSQVGNLKGWHIDGGIFDRSEPAYIEAIVKDVTKKLGSKSTNVSKDLVGIDHQMEHIVQLIEEENSRIIGIWGMGGIGKTTLADAVYNKVLSYSDKFDAHHFLHNVREKSLGTNGLQSLRRELLSELLREDISIDTPSIGCTLIKDRLQSLKVLVVLDDVDNLDQIEHLGSKYFGPGSKIIVTSRDRQVLLNIGVDICHQVNELSEYNSLQLFSKHAFKQNNHFADFQDLAMKFVGYAKGIPLALKVLGAALLDKSRDEWEGAWEKREEYPEKRIFGPLKISYDGLDDLEKNIFLDIACFHNGGQEYVVEEILLRSYKGAKSGIGNLVDKCLIDKCLIDGDRYSFRMHDLLQEMGRYFVRQESEDPERRSRLWSPSDVCYVLQNNKGTRSIKGISMNVDAITAVHIRHDAFKEMVDLKFIKFYGERFGKGCNKLLLSNNKLKYLPDELRYFRWDYYPLKSLPSKFSPNNLVELSLHSSNIERLWSGDEDVVNLKALDVSWCKNLRKIPNLSRATKLERLNCCGCQNLVELSCMTHLTSLKDVVNLKALDVGWCKNLRKIPILSRATKLESLNCSGCQNLVELPCMTHLTSLEKLCLDFCPINKFPKIPTNGALECLELRWTEIEEVPLHWTSLRRLELAGCPITKFPATNGVLEEMDLGGTRMEEVPSHQWSLFFLNVVVFVNCVNLVEINFNTTPIKEMDYLDVSNCKSLKSLLGLPLVEKLSARNCTSLERVSFDTNPRYGRELFDFSNCFKLSEDIIAMHPLIRWPAVAKRFAKGLEEDELDDFTELDGFIGRNNKIDVICYLPRSEISKKFENQNRNSWITVKLGSTARTRFLCFALCLVLDSDDLPHGTSCKYNIECKYQLKGGINGDKNFRLTFRSLTLWYDDDGSGQHVYLLFGEKMVHRDMQYTKASFASRVFGDDKKLNVEKCGVHVFYVDAESFAVSHAVSSIDFSSDGQDIDEEHVDFNSDEDTSSGEGSMVEEDEDATRGRC